MSDEKNLMVKLKASTKDYLKGLAKQKNESMTQVIEDLLEEHKNRSFFEGLASDYAALRQDKKAWSELAEEQSLWDTTASDGLDEK